MIWIRNEKDIGM